MPPAALRTSRPRSIKGVAAMLLASSLIACCYFPSNAFASRIMSRTLLETSEGSDCVSKQEGFAIKPDGSNWSKKVEDASVDECLRSCEAVDGYFAVVYNNDNEDCYCWEGMTGWVWAESESEDTYLVNFCQPLSTPGSPPSPPGYYYETPNNEGPYYEVNDDELIEDDLGRIRGDLEPFSCGDFGDLCMSVVPGCSHSYACHTIVYLSLVKKLIFFVHSGGPVQQQPGWVHGPDSYGCTGEAELVLKPGDEVEGWLAGESEGTYQFDGALSMCKSIVNANVGQNIDSPDIPCLNCFISLTEDG
eukprot:scaffold317769_cov45-Prasinocladus_malaysianus.AAC.1